MIDTAPASFSVRQLTEARARISAVVAAMGTVVPVLFSAVAVSYGQPPAIAIANLACGLVCGGLWLRARRGYRASTDRAIAMAVMATLSTICAVQPQVATLTFFTPVIVFVLCAEPSARWRGGLLAAACVQVAIVLARVAVEEVPALSPGDAARFETIHCLVVGICTMAMVQIYRGLGTRVRETSAAYADRLRESVAAASASVEELAATSVALAETNDEIAASAELQRGVQAELAATYEQLEQFGNAASHDLKEPIRTIRAFTQLLRREANSPPPTAGAAVSPRLSPDAPESDAAQLSEHFDYVDGACVAMQTLLDKLLIYHRTSAAHEDGVACESLAVDRVWSAALAAELDAREDDGAVVETDLIFRTDDGRCHLVDPACAPPPALATLAIRGHRQYTETAFREVIRNGLLFRAAGDTAPRRLVCEVSAIGEDSVRVTVTDNGIGIAAAYREQVFGMFKRLHPREVYGGAGLGLPLVRRIIEEAGGKVYITGEQDAGATVVMDFVRAPRK